MAKTIVLGIHAEQVLLERGLERVWVEETARIPEWTEPDPSDPTLERRFRAIPARDGRILRVVCREIGDTIHVVTAFLDRRARRPA